MAGHEVLVFTGSQQMLRRSPGSMRWTEHCSIPVPNIYKCKSGAWLNAIPSKGLGLHFQTSRNPCCIRVHLFRLPAFDSVLSMRIVAILSDQSPKHPQCSRKRSVRGCVVFPRPLCPHFRSHSAPRLLSSSHPFQQTGATAPLGAAFLRNITTVSLPAEIVGQN